MAGTDTSTVEESRQPTAALRHVTESVGVLRKTYAVLFGLFFLANVAALAIAGPQLAVIGQAAFAIIGLATLAFSYLGLRLRKAWAAPLILFWSARCALPTAVRGPETFVELLFDRAFLALVLYQLWFFTLHETRSFLGADGTALF